MTCYEIYYNQILAIIKNFKTQPYNLKGYKYKIFIFINFNNFYYFINIKNLRFRQVC